MKQNSWAGVFCVPGMKVGKVNSYNGVRKDNSVRDGPQRKTMEESDFLKYAGGIP